jgi:hypothetical protein
MLWRFKKLIMKSLFPSKRFFLQSSKVGIISELDKKSCIVVIFLEKNFFSNGFVLTFVGSKIVY